MALLWMDGFDHYDGNIANTVLNGYVGQQNVILTNERSRNGVYSLRSNDNSSTNPNEKYLAKAIPNLQTVGVGFSFYPTGFFDSSTIRPFLAFASASTGYQLVFNVNYAGVISVTRNNYVGTPIANTSSVISTNVWNHIEVRVHFSNTVGSIQIRVNGVEVMNISNLDTVWVNPEYATAVYLHPMRGPSPIFYWYFDDFYVWDTSGTYNNTFLGDRKVITLNPNNTTATAEWGITGAANAISAISSNDGDSSYISAGSSVPVTSDFELSNADSTVGAIAGLMSVSCARKVESGTVILQHGIVSGGSVSNGSPSHSITDNYAYYGSIHETDPQTGVPWTVSALNNARLRLRRTT